MQILSKVPTSMLSMNERMKKDCARAKVVKQELLQFDGFLALQSHLRENCERRRPVEPRLPAVIEATTEKERGWYVVSR